MAQTFTALFQWIKKIPLFRAVVPDSKDPDRSISESPNSSTSTAEEPLPPAECILDIEALRSQPSSSPLSISSRPTTPAIQSSSSLSPKKLFPVFTRNSIGPQSADRSRATSQSREEDISDKNNPIAQLFQDQDLGKTIIAFVMPMTAAFLSAYAPASDLVRYLIFSLLALGLAALWNGILLRRILPRQAITIEQIGAGLVLLAYCGLIGSLLPDYLLWIPCFCFLLVLIPFFWSYYLDRIAHP